MSSSATDDSTAGDGEDSGSSPEMQAAMDDIDNPATKFDDNCKKKFSKSDCSLMFRPNKGPDFAALGKDKWAKMCSTLLNRPAADCEKEFQFGMNGGPKPNGMFGQGGASQGPALDPAKVAAACAAIGMSETDCRDAIKAGPMVALQKFGSKSELFCTTYGAASCADLMAKMAPPGNPSSQPGAPGGSTQQPQQGAGGNGPSNDKIKAACATAGVSDDDCSKLMSANAPGSTMRPRDIVMSWGADKSEKFCQAIAQRSCSELMK
jgi:hypothetical protein